MNKCVVLCLSIVMCFAYAGLLRTSEVALAASQFIAGGADEQGRYCYCQEGLREVFGKSMHQIELTKGAAKFFGTITPGPALRKGVDLFVAVAQRPSWKNESAFKNILCTYFEQLDVGEAERLKKIAALTMVNVGIWKPKKDVQQFVCSAVAAKNFPVSSTRSPVPVYEETFQAQSLSSSSCSSSSSAASNTVSAPFFMHKGTRVEITRESLLACVRAELGKFNLVIKIGCKFENPADSHAMIKRLQAIEKELSSSTITVEEGISTLSADGITIDRIKELYALDQESSKYPCLSFLDDIEKDWEFTLPT